MSDDLAHATTLVERAEREPLLGNRVAPVRAAIDEAAAVLDRVDAPVLRARILLRLAEAKLVEQDLEGADQALAAVGDHVPDHAALRFLTGVRACRVALRRGPAQRKQAHDLLMETAARLPQFDAEDVLWQRVASEVSIGVAEIAVHDDPPDDDALEPVRQLVAELADSPAHVDVMFTARQLLATYAISIGDGARAATHLRALVEIARTVGSPADEVEARLALAGVLTELARISDPGGTHVLREEAIHHVNKAHDRARDAGLPHLQHAALLAQAGALAETGKVGHAIDRVLELARTAAADQDVTRYVASVGIMAELYARSGDVVSAFRTIVESHRALAQATGSDTTALFRPHLAALRDRVGADRLEQIAADVAKADALSAALADKTSRDPS